MVGTSECRDDFIEDPGLDLAPLWWRVARAFLGPCLVSCHAEESEEDEWKDTGNLRRREGTQEEFI